MGDKMKDRNTIYKIIFIASIACTAVVILTNGITKGAGNIVNPVGYQTVLYVTLALYAVALVLSLVFVKPVRKDK